jgi:hypothetical protein
MKQAISLVRYCQSPVVTTANACIDLIGEADSVSERKVMVEAVYENYPCI